METVPVLIIGAGPSGLALGLSLAKYGIESLILEKAAEITEDPRGVILNGDAVRIMYDLGLGNAMPEIGQATNKVYFHKSDFRAKPFFTMDLSSDLLHQSLPTGILMNQPRLEQKMEELIATSGYCKLRRGCEARSQKILKDGYAVSYIDASGTSKSVGCSWLIGADGKKGVVRKHFLEKQHDIKQETGIFEYEGTWVAANLHLTPPTPASHPELPFWSMGLTSEDVYELYWPDGCHFCNPPGKPTASGAFGHPQDRLWRHEFLEDPWDPSKDAEELLWDHLTPMITRSADRSGNPFPAGSITYPRDCIELKRCRPVRFVQKVVNRWFVGHTVLIGDAAHVFPPFAGQGIASGVRDAHQLAWRLAIILRAPHINANVAENLLTAWASERREGIDDAARLTRANSQLLNEPEGWIFFLSRHLNSLWQRLPFVESAENNSSMAEVKGFTSTTPGFFLPRFDGGGRIPQARVAAKNGDITLSDCLLQPRRVTSSIFTVLSIQHHDRDAAAQLERAQRVIRECNMETFVVNEHSVVSFNDTLRGAAIQVPDAQGGQRLYSPLEEAVLQRTKPFGGQLPLDATFAILRPDFYIYAVLKDLHELESALAILKSQLWPAAL